MTATTLPLCTAFAGDRILARGPIGAVALAVRDAARVNGETTILTFDDATGKVIDLDLRGSDAEILARLDVSGSGEPLSGDSADGQRGRGRPKLGVVAREVTLLPRHWDWLATQPGGASVVLRKLVEQARRDDAGQGRTRAAQEAAYRFMSAMAGDLPAFEEAARALFAGDREAFDRHVAAWPADLRRYADELAWSAA